MAKSTLAYADENYSKLKKTSGSLVSWLLARSSIIEM